MPTRYLKPGIRDSAHLESLSAHPDAEILYTRLIVSVDDFGRTDARPLMIKALCFPIRLRATADKCMQWLKLLQEVGLISIYDIDSKPYLQITKWDNKPRATHSKYPAPTPDVYSCPQMLPANREPLTVNREPEQTLAPSDCEKPQSSSPTDPVNGFAAIPLADKSEYRIPQTLLTELEAAYPAVDVPSTLREIRAWCLTNPEKRKTPRGVGRFLNRWFERVQNHG